MDLILPQWMFLLYFMKFGESVDAMSVNALYVIEIGEFPYLYQYDEYFA